MVSGQILASGYLTNTIRVLYVVPSGKTAAIRWASFFNEGAITTVLRLYIRRAQKPRGSMSRAELAEFESAHLVDEGESLDLSAGDAIEGTATINNVVTILITGSET